MSDELFKRIVVAFLAVIAGSAFAIAINLSIIAGRLPR